MFEYSRKLMENLRHPSSIQDPGRRTEVFVPYSNSMDDLLNGFYNYIGADKFVWNNKLNNIDKENKTASFTDGTDITGIVEYEHLITTIPMPVLYNACDLKCPYELKSKTLYITNYKTTNIVPNWLIALYMSDPKFPPYRITVLNNILSMESLTKLSYENEVIIKYVIGDLFDYELSSKSEYAWETGRIFGIQKLEREEIINSFKSKDIHLLGRYSEWNGKLLIDSTIARAKEIVDGIIK